MHEQVSEHLSVKMKHTWRHYYASAVSVLRRTAHDAGSEPTFFVTSTYERGRAGTLIDPSMESNNTANDAPLVREKRRFNGKHIHNAHEQQVVSVACSSSGAVSEAQQSGPS